MGLGLPIVKRTIFDHNGRVDIDSNSAGHLRQRDAAGQPEWTLTEFSELPTSVELRVKTRSAPLSTVISEMTS